MAIVITGAAGFIGSCLVSFLNQKGREDLILVDDFGRPDKQANLSGKHYSRLIDRNEFLQPACFEGVEVVFHMGARTDTTEFDTRIFDELNESYSREIWNFCAQLEIPLIYASSAATYGDGEQGFMDDEFALPTLQPLNPYGQSKHNFDLWARAQEVQPPFWCGLKFFNVFGPNEYHKGRMASVVLHAYRQIKETGELKLFQSHKSDYAHGEQKRDFIYVKDLLNLMWFWYRNQQDSGIYNAGTGQAGTFNTLAHAIFEAMDLPARIQYIPTPEDIRDTYQYFTEADMHRTLEVGYTDGFTELDEAVRDYVRNYLQKDAYY